MTWLGCLPRRILCYFNPNQFRSLFDPHVPFISGGGGLPQLPTACSVSGDSGSIAVHRVVHRFRESLTGMSRELGMIAPFGASATMRPAAATCSRVGRRRAPGLTLWKCTLLNAIRDRRRRSLKLSHHWGSVCFAGRSGKCQRPPSNELAQSITNTAILLAGSSIF